MKNKGLVSIEIAGQVFYRRARGVKPQVPEVADDAAGFFNETKHVVRLFTLDGQLFGAMVRNGNYFVNATLDEGKARYFFGASSLLLAGFGLGTGSGEWARERKVVGDALKQLEG